MSTEPFSLSKLLRSSDSGKLIVSKTYATNGFWVVLRGRLDKAGLAIVGDKTAFPKLTYTTLPDNKMEDVLVISNSATFASTGMLIELDNIQTTAAIYTNSGGSVRLYDSKILKALGNPTAVKTNGAEVNRVGVCCDGTAWIMPIRSSEDNDNTISNTAKKLLNMYAEPAKKPIARREKRKR
jgi:hypothetical protein